MTKARAKPLVLVLIGVLAWWVTKYHPSKYNSSDRWVILQSLHYSTNQPRVPVQKLLEIRYFETTSFAVANTRCDG